LTPLHAPGAEFVEQGAKAKEAKPPPDLVPHRSPSGALAKAAEKVYEDDYPGKEVRVGIGMGQSIVRGGNGMGQSIVRGGNGMGQNIVRGVMAWVKASCALSTKT